MFRLAAQAISIMSTELKLLLLEDDAADAELILRFLRKSGLDPDATIASDEAEFSAAIENDVFDAILADNSLPQFSSIDALKRLQEEKTNSAFILVTGTVSEEFAVEIIRQGADDYILKNNLTRLPSAITQAIEKRRTRKEKLEAEAALIQSERRYRTLFQRNLAGVYQSTIGGEIIDCNTAFCRMLGYAHPVELRTISYRDLFFSELDLTVFLDRLQEKKFLSNFEVVLRRKNGDPLYVIGNISLVENQETGLHLVEGIITDITDRKKAEEDLRQMNQELHDLSSHLQYIREEERTQIARDIHDDLGQLLTALKMDVFALKQQIRPDDEAAVGKFAGIVAIIEEAVGSVRRIAAHLRPSIIDDLGLVAALSWQGQEIEKRYGIPVNFRCNLPEMDAPAATVTALFRIYQEALTNVVRHARATRVDSRLRVAGGRIILEIKDDGIGINAGTGKGKSFGLLGIKERVFLMQGHYELSSEPGKGTALYISVPA